MNREILFRGKSVDNGEWIRGDLIATPFIKRTTQQYITYILDVTKADYDCFEDLVEDNGIFEVVPDSVGQYTGLTDKNGKKIFERDIISAWSEGSHAVGVVKQRIDGLWLMYPAWQNHKMWGLCPNSKGETTVEVIGNIFDNPELLEH